MHHETITHLKERLNSLNISFTQKPIVIGGMAMQYYGMRQSGPDIDLIVSDQDYQLLAEAYPDKRKDLYGDLGVLIEEFEIWRSIALLDYDYFLKDAIDEEDFFMVSIDRLLWMRVCAMEVDKYRKDLDLMIEYYYNKFRNPNFLQEAETHIPSYEKFNGVVFGGTYDDK